jgi:hypothetical protein
VEVRRSNLRCAGGDYVTGCGGSESTTAVIKEAAPTTVEVPAKPAAEQALKAAGFAAAASNTDTMFATVGKSHYTIGTEGKPRGSLVLAQKCGR